MTRQEKFTTTKEKKKEKKKGRLERLGFSAPARRRPAVECQILSAQPPIKGDCKYKMRVQVARRLDWQPAAPSTRTNDRTQVVAPSGLARHTEVPQDTNTCSVARAIHKAGHVGEAYFPSFDNDPSFAGTRKATQPETSDNWWHINRGSPEAPTPLPSRQAPSRTPPAPLSRRRRPS